MIQPMYIPRHARLTLAATLLLLACSAPPPTSEQTSVPFQQQSRFSSTDDLNAPAVNALGLDSSQEFEYSELSLQQTIDLVLQRNPSVEIAAAHIAQASAAIAESQAAFRPRVNLDWGYLRADAPSAFLFKTIDARGFVPGTDFNNPGVFNNWEAGLGVGYNLYSGGSHQLAVEIANLQKRGAELGFSTLQNKLTAMTIDLWFAAQVARKQQQVAELSLRTVQAQLDETQILFEEGKVLRSDVLSLQVRLAEAKEVIVRSSNGVVIARIGLSSLLAVAEAQLPKLAVSGDKLPNLQEPQNLSTALRQAFELRPELEQLRVSIQQSELQLKRVQAGAKPSVDLFGRAWADNPNIDFGGSEANWSVGFAASWSLFDGGARSARAARAKAQLAEVHARHRALLSEVRQDVELTYLALGEAQARLEVAQGAVELAQESLRLVRAQYEGGVATITRYLEAEQMLTFARQRLYQSSFDRKRAIADLARAMGIFAPA